MSGFAPLRMVLGTAFLGAMLFAPSPVDAQGAASSAQTTTVRLGPSGLPLPRFVSLKSGRVNSRIGPGVNYSVDWMYTKAGLPMEIVQEYDTWRRVRDAEGAEGWINQSLLSGKRTAIVAPWQRGKGATVNLLDDPSQDAGVVAILEPGVMGTIKSCNGQWCEMTFDGHKGWINQSSLWGAYPGEKVKD
ncbi:MAG: SH3 domain-containing protein [Mesorhizobium sp.]